MTFLSSCFIVSIFLLTYLYFKPRNHTGRDGSLHHSEIMSSKSKDAQFITELRSITGATKDDAAKLYKKHKNLEMAIGAFYDDQGMLDRAEASRSSNGGAGSSGSSKGQEKKLGEIWERFKDPSDPKLIKIEGTMEMCEELGIDPESDVVLFCLAADLGSKATGEWEKAPFVSGWAKMPGNIDSIEGMKKRLPALRQQLYSSPAYFKKVYMHTFDLAKAAGARTLGLETALSLWPIFIEPALSSSPSALSHLAPGQPPTAESSDPPQFTTRHFELWIEFQTKKGKAVSKDTWNLFVDFIRTIDSEFKDYDEEAAWPSTIDDFVEYVRANK